MAGPLEELVNAACAWGWAGAPPEGSAASSPSAARAEQLIAEAPAELRRQLPVACLAGDVQSVRSALEADPSLIRRPLPPRGWEPVLYVSYSVLLSQPGPRSRALLEAARLLLARGADPNAHYRVVPDPGCTFPALYAAIAVTGNLELARVLLEAGADPNDGQSAYHAAERWDNEALDLLAAHGLSAKEISYCLFHKLDFAHDPGVRWFLDHGADPNGHHPKEDETPLHWAVKRTCSPQTVTWLLEAGADPSARTRDGFTAFPRIRGFTPLDLSERLGRHDVSAVLLAAGAERGPRTAADDFAVACAGGDRQTALRLLGEEPDLLEKLLPEDRELMAHVAQQDSAAGVELMLELGFSATEGGWGGSTPLHWAACRGNRALVRALLAPGVPLVDLPGPARTPLHQALYHRWNPAGDYVGVLEELIAAGVPLDEELAPTGDPALDAALARLRTS